MVLGLMQPTQLQIASILRYAQQAHGGREIVSRQIDEPVWRYDYARFAKRVERAAKALRRLGVKPGDRVTSLAWNTHRHLELFYAVPGLGAVLNTVNPRLFDEQIVYILDHSQAEVLFYDRTFQPIVERLNAAINKVLGEAPIRAKLDTYGITPVADSTPASTAAHIQREIVRWGEAFKLSGAQQQ